MAEYHTKLNDFSSFEVSGDGKSIGKVSYKNWFQFNADVEIVDNANYQLEPKGFWGTTTELKDKEKILVQFDMGWTGNIAIKTFFNSLEKDYLFKHHGIFQESFVLTDLEDTELLSMKPHVKWRLLNYEYQITSSEIFESLASKEILLMNSVHCANYYMWMFANSGAY